jgi:hypothetical protein
MTRFAVELTVADALDAALARPDRPGEQGQRDQAGPGVCDHGFLLTSDHENSPGR